MSLHAAVPPLTAASGTLAGCRTIIYGYGQVDEAPTKGEFPALEVARPGDLLQLPVPAPLGAGPPALHHD